jgi:hypothetical protein
MAIADVLNFSSTTPAAPTGKQLVVPQNDGGSPTCNQSFYDPLMTGDTGTGGLAGNVPAPTAGSAAAGKFLKADATWAVPLGSGTFVDEIITFSGTSGSFSHAPAILIGLYLDGQRLTQLGSSPDFSSTGTPITLTVAATSGELYEAVYFW